jgi:AcrR family transcriptional regulator
LLLIHYLGTIGPYILDRTFQDVNGDLMSGKPQFDDSVVIAAAVDVFWRHGYAASSVSELTDATGLSRSSLYQRFADKDGLFLEAIQTYTERALRRMNAVQADTARDQLEGLLRAFLPDASRTKRPAGCLIARSCNEAEDLSATGRTAAQAAATRQREVLVNILRKGVQNGELSHDADVDALAWLYFGVLQAVVNFPHAGADPGTLNRMIDVAMASWPANNKLRQRRAGVV